MDGLQSGEMHPFVQDFRTKHEPQIDMHDSTETIDNKLRGVVSWYQIRSSKESKGKDVHDVYLAFIEIEDNLFNFDW